MVGGGGALPYLKVVGKFPAIVPYFLTFSDPVESSFYGSTRSQWPPLSAEKNCILSIPLSSMMIGPKVGLIFLYFTWNSDIDLDSNSVDYQLWIIEIHTLVWAQSWPSGYCELSIKSQIGILCFFIPCIFWYHGHSWIKLLLPAITSTVNIHFFLEHLTTYSFYPVRYIGLCLPLFILA